MIWYYVFALWGVVAISQDFSSLSSMFLILANEFVYCCLLSQALFLLIEWDFDLFFRALNFWLALQFPSSLFSEAKWHSFAYWDRNRSSKMRLFLENLKYLLRMWIISREIHSFCWICFWGSALRSQAMFTAWLFRGTRTPHRSSYNCVSWRSTFSDVYGGAMSQLNPFLND